MFNFSVVFAVKLASRYICFKYLALIALKELFFRPVTWQKYLGLTSLWFCRDIARNKDFRQRYLCLPEVVDKICCLRSTPIRLHNSKWFKQNGLLLNVETGSHELAILSYATVCPHPFVSLNNEKICREFSEHKIVVCMWENCGSTEWELFGFVLCVLESVSSRRNISVLRHAVRNWTISGLNRRSINCPLVVQYNNSGMWVVLPRPYGAGSN